MRNPFFIFLMLCYGNLFSQSTVVATATQFIVEKKYEEADRYLDSVLKADKNNVDALMMKGNIILNKEDMEKASIALTVNDDEYLYESNLAGLGENYRIISAAIANKVAALWKQCLKIDNTRLDIHKGLCTLYAMALMKEELKKQLYELYKVEKVTNETAYSMAEYARKFKERKRFDDAMDIYKTVAKLFPNLGGIRCDIGSEYFYHGDLKPALQWLDSALSKPDLDEATYLNAAFVYSELGYFDNAQKVLDEYSKKYERRMNRFYYGLRQFADVDSHYVETFNYFISVVDSNAYYDEVKMAKQLLVFQDSFPMAAYRYLIRSNIPEYYRVFIYQRGLKEFPKQCEVYTEYGSFHLLLKNYPAAVQFLQEGEDCTLDSAKLDYWRASYGYVLYVTGNKEKALNIFQPVLQSPKVYWNHAANYFSAKILLEKKREAEAVKLLQNVVSSPEEDKSKYKLLAKDLLGKLKK
jgi:tetratricopeptide (TPR) repeat protein